MTDVKKNSYDKGQNFAVSIGKEECPFPRNGVEGWVDGGSAGGGGCTSRRRCFQSTTKKTGGKRRRSFSCSQFCRVLWRSRKDVKSIRLFSPIDGRQIALLVLVKRGGGGRLW